MENKNNPVGEINDKNLVPTADVKNETLTTQEPTKVLTVMERYATAPSVSHLLILIVSLLLIAILITPNIAYVYYGGFAEINIIPFIDFPLAFLSQVGHPVEFPHSEAWKLFDPNFIQGIVMPMTHQVKNIYPFVMSACGGLGGLLFTITAVYSFICVVGGVGRKHTVGLVYTLLVGAIIAFAPAIAMSVFAILAKSETVLYPLFPGIALIVVIILVIAVHVTYAKRIKNTISEKEFNKINAETSKQEQSVEEPIEKHEVREDSINNKDSIIEEVIAQNKERDVVLEAANADENLILEGAEPKTEPVRKPIIEEKPIIVETNETVVEEKPREVLVEKPTRPVPVPPKHIVKVQVNNDIDPSKGLKALPEGTVELGDHAYSKNLDLEFAIIPEGVEKIGPACFANCLNLKMVQLPASLTKISFNAFFACKKLTKIVYSGSKVEWKKIARGSNWLTSAGTKVIICKDGAISVNPFH